LIAHDKVIVETTVAVPPARAFEIFTRETELWWRRGPRYRVAGGMLELEPRLGGRLMEKLETAKGAAKIIVVGTVLAWEPPARLLLEWRNVNFAKDEKTEVEVRFEKTPSGSTRVTLEHRGWSAIRADHPARHGKQGRELIAFIGGFWADLLTAMRLST
jgi:uncharacterized protein YndB with AHSA1/START domain